MHGCTVTIAWKPREALVLALPTPTSLPRLPAPRPHYLITIVSSDTLLSMRAFYSDRTLFISFLMLIERNDLL